MRRAIPALAWLAALAACSDAPPHGIRHVVVVSLDTTRADHVGPFGAERVRTPYLDRLAAGGVVFRDVTAPATTTLASTTSIMTGCYPQTHGVVRNGFVVHQDNEMLAELLARAGFRTAGFLASFALDRRFGFAQGFAHFDQEFDVLMNVGQGGHDQNQRRAERVTDAVLSWLDGADPERLFLFVHYFDPHQPYDPPQPFDREYTPDGRPATSTAADVGRAVEAHQVRAAGRALGVSAVANDGLTAELVQGADGEPLPDDRLLADLYAGEVTYMDAQLGRLLDGLAQRGYLRDALVVVTGDHGETFWEHGDTWNHGLWVYQTTVHVPLVVRLPDGHGAGSAVDTPVSTVDVVPTICELLELSVPARAEGTSLVPLLDGAALARGPLYCQATQPFKREPREGWANRNKPHCVREGRWKFVSAPYLDIEQLFDLEADPAEQRDLLRSPTPQSTAVAERLRAALGIWIAGADPLPSHFDASQMDENLRRLEAMGYGGPGGDEEPDDGASSDE